MTVVACSSHGDVLLHLAGSKGKKMFLLLHHLHSCIVLALLRFTATRADGEDGSFCGKVGGGGIREQR